MSHIRFLSLCLIGMLAFLTACEGTSTSATSRTPAAAKGDTPVRFIVCSFGDVNCKVFARFDDLGSCEVHKEFASARCDFDTTPGKIICSKVPGRDTTVVAYCLL